ncbi:MAG TPA: response regulator [Burkholderiales bacterium]|nr:response regulator [Burkholderiales bacterium]
MPGSDFTVDLVDDDVGVLQGLHRLLCAAGFAARCFSSAEDFLASHDPSVPGCVILDVGLSKWNGLAVQEIIANADGTCPVIFLTGSSDVPTSVRAMKAGAVDFLTKPVQEDALFQAIARAQALDSAARRLHDEQRAIHRRLEQLSPRERQVLAHVVAGRLNKQIAADLGTVEKTIKVHRGRMMSKMGVRHVVELVRLADRAGVAVPRTSADNSNVGLARGGITVERAERRHSPPSAGEGNSVSRIVDGSWERLRARHEIPAAMPN